MADETNSGAKTPHRIAVFGLGYVGCVSATCLAELGHDVVGVDIAESKVCDVNAGTTPVLEPGLSQRLQRVVAEGRLRATLDPAEAVGETDVALICVGTPSRSSGAQDLRYVERVVRQIGEALRHRDSYYGVVIRSTVVPGTVDGVVLPLLQESSGRASNRDFGCAHLPEFLREGSALADFFEPPYTVVGTTDARLAKVLREIFAPIRAPFMVTQPRVAESLKLVCNLFHALKVAFANEVGTLCKAMGVDGRQLMELFVKDTKLNVSEKYLRPGFAFGGSCLPKDVRALSYLGRSFDLQLPVLDSVMRSNELHVRRGISLVESTQRKKVGLLGLAFKPGTDDLRESPVVQLAETLLGRGYELRIYDPLSQPARFMGSNKRFVDEHLPHLARLMVDSAQEVVDLSEVIVVGHESEEFRLALGRMNGARHIVDLAGIEQSNSSGSYLGIAW